MESTILNGEICNWYKGQRSFQKLERGEETTDSDDSSFWKVGSDVRDDLSMLPRKIALTVRWSAGRLGL